MAHDEMMDEMDEFNALLVDPDHANHPNNRLIDIAPHVLEQQTSGIRDALYDERIDAYTIAWERVNADASMQDTWPDSCIKRLESLENLFKVINDTYNSEWRFNK